MRRAQKLNTIMYCPNCGAEIADGSKICPKCGVSTDQNNVINTATNVRAPKSVGGFVCSLLGFLLDWIPLVGLILSIVGVALCGSGKKEVNKNPQRYSGTGLLTAGQVLGIIGIVVSSFALIFTVIWGIILGNGGFFSLMEEFVDILDL